MYGPEVRGIVQGAYAPVTLVTCSLTTLKPSSLLLERTCSSDAHYIWPGPRELVGVAGYYPSSLGADTNGVTLGVTPRVLPSVCLAVLVQWRRPRESPSHKGSRWIRFLSPIRRPKDNLFEEILVIKLGSPRELPWFRVRDEHEFLDADVKLTVVLTCADIVKMSNRALCSQVGVSPGQARLHRLGQASRLDVKDASYALDNHSMLVVGGKLLQVCSSL